MLARCLLGALFAGAWALAGAAEENPLEPPDLAGYARWGPFRVHPGVAATPGYDDNVFYTTGDEKPRSDYRLTISPTLEGLILFGHRAFLVFDERLDYTAYMKYSGENYLNQRLVSRLTFPFERFGVFADLALIETQDRPTSEFDSRLERREKRAGLGVIVKLGWRTYAELEQIRSDWKFDDPDNPGTSDLLDRLEQSTQLRLSYRLTDQTRLTLEAVGTDHVFDDPTVNRDSVERRLVPGVRFGEGARLRGALRFGLSRFDVKDPAREDYDGLVGEATLAYGLGGKTQMRLSGRREVGFAVFQENSFYLDRSGELRVIRYVSRVVGLEAARGVGTLSFPQAEAGQDRIDDISVWELALRLRLPQISPERGTEYALRFQRWRRDANQLFDEFDQTRSVWGITAGIRF